MLAGSMNHILCKYNQVIRILFWNQPYIIADLVRLPIRTYSVLSHVPKVKTFQQQAFSVNLCWLLFQCE